MTQTNQDACGLPHRVGATQARLRAIVVVDSKDKVRCQQPGCGHSIYAAIHVVEEGGTLLLLGSTCFEKRYGGMWVLGRGNYGSSGGGRTLSDEERLLMMQNTQALLTRFEAQAFAEAQAVAAAQARHQDAQRSQQTDDEAPRSTSDPAYLKTPSAQIRPVQTVGFVVSGPASPWPWQKANTSVAVFDAPRGGY